MTRNIRDISKPNLASIVMENASTIHMHEQWKQEVVHGHHMLA
jgi:hypothetical protein